MNEGSKAFYELLKRRSVIPDNVVDAAIDIVVEEVAKLPDMDNLKLGSDGIVRPLPNCPDGRYRE